MVDLYLVGNTRAKTAPQHDTEFAHVLAAPLWVGVMNRFRASKQLRSPSP